MSQEEAAKLVEYLTTQVENGYTLVTWNGVGFDLDILAEESGMLDPALFTIFCELSATVCVECPETRVIHGNEVGEREASCG